MTRKLYVIVGATGQIGQSLAQHLLKRGHWVTALGRNQKRLEALKSLGAQVVALEDFANISGMVAACAGADALFSFIPPAYAADDYSAYQDKVGEAIKIAIQKNTIRFVLNLSSMGAQHVEGTGPIKGHHRHEQRLNQLSDVNVLHLHSMYFMENLLKYIPLIKQAGFIGSPIRADLPISMISTKDVSAKAADLLERLEFRGHTTFELAGPRQLTLADATHIVGKAINKPNIEYVQFRYSDTEKGLIGSGMNANSARLMIEMYKAFNEDRCHPIQKNSVDHQGKTTIEQFADTFAEIYQ